MLYEEQYVENLTIEQLTEVILERNLAKLEVESTSEIEYIKRRLREHDTMMSGLHHRLNSFDPGQWIEARLQALEAKEVEVRHALGLKKYWETEGNNLSALEDRVRALEAKEVDMRISVSEFIGTHKEFSKNVLVAIQEVRLKNG